MKKMAYTLCFTFNELPAGHAQQAIVVNDAGNLGLALKRGYERVKKRPAVKGKRLKSGRVNFTIEEVETDGDK